MQDDLLIAVWTCIAARSRADVLHQQMMPVRKIPARGLPLAHQVVEQFLGGDGLEGQLVAQIAFEFIFRAGGQQPVGEFQDVSDAL